jgi:hypothetical protein
MGQMAGTRFAMLKKDKNQGAYEQTQVNLFFFL